MHTQSSIAQTAAKNCQSKKRSRFDLGSLRAPTLSKAELRLGSLVARARTSAVAPRTAGKTVLKFPGRQEAQSQRDARETRGSPPARTTRRRAKTSCAKRSITI